MNNYSISHLRYLLALGQDRLKTNAESTLPILKKLGRLLSHHDTYSEKHMENEMLLLVTELIDDLAKEKIQ